MANVYNEPKYDTDTANKGYVDKKIQNLKDGVDDDIEIIDGKISYKSKNFGSQPTPPYRVNDTWMNGTDIYICVRERLIGSFVASDWTKASTYDNTKSILDGGVTTNGTLVVSKGGTVAAGLTAYTSGDDGVRIWAGATINGINSAPFRVTQKGYLYASNANIQGTITATAGTIGGCSITNGQLSVPFANVTNVAITNAQIDSLSVNKITAGNNNAAVSFSNITSTGGKIGGWTISDHKIYGTYRLSSSDSTNRVCMMQMPEWDDSSGHHYGNWVFAAGGTNHDNYGNCPFRVSKYGELYSTAGQIGGWTIGSNSLSASYTDTSYNYVRKVELLTGSNTGPFYLTYKPTGTTSEYDAFHIDWEGGLIYPYASVAGTNYGLYLRTSGASNKAIRMNNLYSSYETGKIWLSFGNTPNNSPARIRSDGSNLCFFTAPNNYIYAGDTTDADKIATQGGYPSSLNVKTNLQSLDKDYDVLYEEMKQVKAYDYDYKYSGIEDDMHGYGFIIDEIENTEHLSHYFKNYEVKRMIKDGNLQRIDPDVAGPSEGEILDLKTWDTNGYIKGLFVMIKTLQHKIDQLEEEIAELKEG